MRPYETPIWTLNARDNLFLEVVQKEFSLGPDVMHREIQQMHVVTQEILASKGLRYEALRAALVPQTDKHEAAFIFDSTAIASWSYGAYVAGIMLPLLDRRSPQSVLCGDLIAPNQELIFEVLRNFMVPARTFTFRHGTALYCFYVNNLASAAVDTLHHVLREKTNAYVGYIPSTYQTIAKSYLSTTVANVFIKYRDRVIMAHEDDRPNDENVNMQGWPYEESGYGVASLQSMYFDVLLAFKIERSLFRDDVDSRMALNAISRDVQPIDSLHFTIDEAKFKYVRENKIGKLEMAQVDHLTRSDLEALIREKISASYIYNLAYQEPHDVMKFDVIIEVPRTHGGYPTRFVAALKYLPAEKELRLITFT